MRVTGPRHEPENTSISAPVHDAGALPTNKFAYPRPQSAFVSRPRLLERLDLGYERPLTLLSAPPGTGKTALLGNWISAGGPPGPVAWLSLDPADGDRRRFRQAVLAALLRAGAGAAVETLAAQPNQRSDLFARELADALSGLQHPVVLVLDDFHEIGDAVYEDLDAVLRHPIPELRVVIATRADPALHLGRLRLEDQLIEIRAPDLAFTLEETAQALESLGVALGDHHVRRLWEHTEGWVGAVRLAGLTLREHPAPERFVDDFAGDDRAVSDYLLSEVMSSLSPDDRRFLLRTSIASVLSGELANALTDRTDGSRKLAELARNGAFLAPLDRRGEWYRYHSLLAELLRAELRNESPEQLDDLHRRAALWFAAERDDARALLHAVEGGAWDVATSLAGERWVDLLIRGEVAVLRPLLDRMPPEWADGDPELALALASAVLDRGDEITAEALVRRAEEGASRVQPERRPRFDVSLATVRLHIARLRGDLTAALRAGRELVDRGELEPGIVETDLRALALTNLGIAELWSGDPAVAARHLERARGAAIEAGRDWLVLIAVAHLALVAGTQDDYARSARHAREALALAERRGWERTWAAGGAYLALTTAEFLANRFDEAAVALEHAQEALAGTRERPLRAGLALLRSGLLATRGQVEIALAVLVAGAEELGEWPLRATIREHFAAREAVLRAELGERREAIRLADADGAGPASLPSAVVLAKLRLADGDVDAARETIEPWRPRLERERTPATVQAWMVEALALDATADHDGAARSLERALEQAEPGGLRWPLLDFGRAVQPLLRRQLRRGTAHRALVGELLETLDDAEGAGSRASLVVAPLSPRERAVLRYLPTMMSNQEIAAELFVSVNTVKTHLKAIYRKLDVTDRREAVRRARTLNLLAP
jgi:LuxR family transcriptional regulator, maltose regulon positive regulatory protein